MHHFLSKSAVLICTYEFFFKLIEFLDEFVVVVRSSLASNNLEETFIFEVVIRGRFHKLFVPYAQLLRSFLES